MRVKQRTTQARQIEQTFRSTPIWFLNRKILCCAPVLLGLVVALGGCSSTTRIPEVSNAELDLELERQIELATTRAKNGLQQVTAAAWPLLSQASNICRDRVTNGYGFYLSFKEKLPIVASFGFPNARLQFGVDATIWAVAPNSPAERAALRVDDRIVAVNGQTVNSSKEIKRLVRTINKRDSTGSLHLTLRRGTEELEATVESQRVCDSDLKVADVTSVNASANGNTITINSMMLEFVENERELQFVIAHELAHNIEGHIRKKAFQYAAGGFVDAFILFKYRFFTRGRIASLGTLPYSRDLEREADYVGMYVLANAGVDTTGIEDFWRRLGTHNRNTIGFVWTHPATAERAALLRNTTMEIERKKRQGLPLTPERRGRR